MFRAGQDLSPGPLCPRGPDLAPSWAAFLTLLKAMPERPVRVQPAPAPEDALSACVPRERGSGISKGLGTLAEEGFRPGVGLPATSGCVTLGGSPRFTGP